MNYCPVCKREYREGLGYQTGRCPVCGSRLILITDDDLDVVRKNDSPASQEQ